MADFDAVQFIGEAYKHCKAIAASGAAGELVRASCLEGNGLNGKQKGDKPPAEAGLITGPDAGKITAAFIKAIAQHRHWSREMDPVPAGGARDRSRAEPSPAARSRLQAWDLTDDCSGRKVRLTDGVVREEGGDVFPVNSAGGESAALPRKALSGRWSMPPPCWQSERFLHSDEQR